MNGHLERSFRRQTTAGGLNAKMTASSRGSRAAALLLRSSRHPRVCSDCINHITKTSALSQRSYSVAAAAVKTNDGVSHQPHIQNLPPVTATASAPEYKVKSGVLLSRPPLLTRPLTSFEKAFFFYQKRLNERLTMPFSRYFYFKKDTPADHDWKLKAKERNGQPARELGGYNPYGELGWNDELLVGDENSESSYLMESLVKDAEVRAVEGKDGKPMEAKGDADGEGGKVERPLSTWTEADKAKDVRRLDRKLARTLYLVVKRENGGWGFPAGELVGRENLHQAAERVLVQTAGLNMNTWIVGHVPAGHHIIDPYLNKETFKRTIGEKTFFMKARIMAGQANLKDNLFGLSDFKWLTKQELQKHVAPKYFSSIKNMLADR